METSLFVPNSIIFIFDLANEDIMIPEYNDGILISSTKSCLSVGTQAEVDGEVTIKLINRSENSDKDLCEVVFSGVIETPSQKISVVTSELEKIFEMDVQAKQTEIIIAVDDLQFPSIVLITTS